jgi:hypothetical protein|tara:strand:- start:428 stop:1240 length:813 start_codon:yes stop_codon:yes gene_type:complete
MKKIFAIIILILFSHNANALKLDIHYTGEIITDYIQISNNKKLKLPEGKWEVMERWQWSGYGMKFSCLGLVQAENNELMGGVDICYTMMGGAYVKYMDQALIEAMFKDEYDGCYERPEYYLLELYRKGSTHNCLLIQHVDVMKELHNPDDPYSKDLLARTKQWMRDNPEVKIPPIMLSSTHFYFSRLVGGNWVGVGYSINPKLLNAPKAKHLTEETSEYHKYNIDRFPEHKKIMEKWVSISAQRHIEFENMSKAKTRHKLKLDKYILKNQ